MSGQKETPLTGGRVTEGVVRVGETARRPKGPNTPFVHALLRHLEEVGFEGAPRVRGTDERGREILTFIEGHVPPDLGDFTDEQIVAAANLIRDFHDATAGSLLADDNETVCHNDLSPCNFVFVDGVPRALIDFDVAAPGSRALDLGYALWMWLDIGPGRPDLRDQGRRIRLMCDAYELGDRPDVTGMVDASIRATIKRTQQGPPRPDALGWMKDIAAWLESNREALEQHAR